MDLTNEQLTLILKGCRLNQRGPQKLLYRNYYGYVMAIALRYSNSYDDAVEMTNKAFLSVYRELKNFTLQSDDPLASFTAWLKKRVVNVCIDHVRKHNIKELVAAVDTGQLLPADEQDTGEQMLQHKDIIQCIQQLSPVSKAVFNLHVIEGLSHTEIADKLDISENTSISNLHKARLNLRQLLTKAPL